MRIAINNRLALVHKLDAMREDKFCAPPVRRVAILVVDGQFSLDDAIKATSLLMADQYRNGTLILGWDKAKNVEQSIRKILRFNGISA